MNTLSKIENVIYQNALSRW